MGKSEHTDIHYLPEEKAQPQIKIDAEALLDLLLRAELMMTKVDRIRYATPAIVMIQDVIKELVLAYDFDDDREIHLKRMCANIAVFISMMRIIGRRNAICQPCSFDCETPDSIKLQIVEHLAKLDEGATKWRKSIMRNRGSRARRASSDEPAVPQVIKETSLPEEGS